LLVRPADRDEVIDLHELSAEAQPATLVGRLEETPTDD
jgi:hypothetical protein